MAHRDPAILAAEQAKVERWCSQQGIETTADLAFFFTSEAEALQEAGRAVCEAWAAARSSSERGIAGLVRGLFAAERRGASSPAPKPSVSPTLRPLAREEPRHTSSVRRVRKPTFEKKRGAAPERPGATLKRALQTWDELWRTLCGARLGSADLDAHFVAAFARESPAPQRVFHALKWLVKNFAVDIDLALVTAPVKQKGNQFGGGDQAPVLPPPIVRHLDDLVERCVDYTYWTAVLSAWFMIMGMVRFAHLQRSTLVAWTSETLTMWCRKGKQLGNRLVSFGVCRAGRPYDIQGFITVLRGLLEPLVQNVDSMSSYSLRRASPTVAALAELTEPEKVALGGWLEKGQNVAVSAARYNAEKMRQCEQLRLALRYTLDVVTAGYQPSVWRELLSGCVPAGHGVG
eukprot:s3438_g5.t2